MPAVHLFLHTYPTPCLPLAGFESINAGNDPLMVCCQLHMHLILFVKVIGVLNSDCVHSQYRILDCLYVHTSFT